MKVCPAIALPVELSAVAFACVFWPTATLDEVSVTDTEATATGADVDDVIPNVPVVPVVVTSALIVAFPAATAVSLPVVVTATADGLEDVQVKVPATGVPLASTATADAWVLDPIPSVVGLALTMTRSIVGVPELTTRTALPVFPSEVAVMTASPVETPVIVPPAPTLATVTRELE